MRQAKAGLSFSCGYNTGTSLPIPFAQWRCPRATIRVVQHHYATGARAGAKLDTVAVSAILLAS